MKGKTILVIEDDFNLIKLITYILKKEKYDIITARNGEEGIEKVRANNPSLIIVDLMMPVMDGYKFLMKLKELSLSHIPVIVTTAKSDEAELHKVLSMGIKAYIKKPFDRKFFLEIIKKISPL
ncbi:MAG TPA: response regulator [Candidatus Eremiobacteraeota bacterium]|nr:MAG: Alkaline phosphatase synthesis transcriptional regulatory protein PhoP [bacterium ADurb.Bin363]HPZ07650.1 response regulator [Candidatus Eremiobacteraeota bacterium]